MEIKNMTVFQLICRIVPAMRLHRPDPDLQLRRDVVNRYLTDWRGLVRTNW